MTKLCDLGLDDNVCSVAWTQRGTYLAVGTNNGSVQVIFLCNTVLFWWQVHHSVMNIFYYVVHWNLLKLQVSATLQDLLLYIQYLTIPWVQIWDAAHCKQVRTMEGHCTRVGTLAWNSHLLSSGSRDRSILQRDIRAQDDFVSKFSGHKSEVNLFGFLFLILC